MGRALSIFTNVKVLIIKQRQLKWCFASLFYFCSRISTFVMNIMFFIEAFSRLGICLFRYAITVLLGSSETCYFSTVLTLLLLTIVSMQPYLLPTNGSLSLCLSEA